MLRKLALSLFVTGSLFVTSAISMAFADNDRKCCDGRGYDLIPVSGSAVHYFDTKIVHNSQPTESGLVETTTETIDLTGDLEGRVLYQPTSVYDFVNGTLVNTGRQVFSGTILGSSPVITFDDEFRFDLNLNTGKVKGEVFLNDRISGPRISCTLTIDMTAPPVNGRSELTYTGVCRMKATK